ncbi:hypothetical protein BC829DRAFT_401477, partial [Chytridium lagenaria]
MDDKRLGDSMAQNDGKRMHLNDSERPAKRVKTGSDEFYLRRFQCVYNECRKAFKTFTSLRNHVKVHALKRRYGCDECGNKFMRPQDLERHAAVHLAPDCMSLSVGVGKSLRGKVRAIIFVSLQHLRLTRHVQTKDLRCPAIPRKKPRGGCRTPQVHPPDPMYELASDDDGRSVKILREYSGK